MSCLNLQGDSTEICIAQGGQEHRGQYREGRRGQEGRRAARPTPDGSTALVSLFVRGRRDHLTRHPLRGGSVPREPSGRIELPTPSLPWKCSTTELQGLGGADSRRGFLDSETRIRTRNLAAYNFLFYRLDPPGSSRDPQSTLGQYRQGDRLGPGSTGEAQPSGSEFQGRLRDSCI